MIHCPELPAKDYGDWIPARNNVTTETKLECWENATLVDPSFDNFTCLLSGEWHQDTDVPLCICE